MIIFSEKNIGKHCFECKVKKTCKCRPYCDGPTEGRAGGHKEEVMSDRGHLRKCYERKKWHYSGIPKPKPISRITDESKSNRSSCVIISSDDEQDPSTPSKVNNELITDGRS